MFASLSDLATGLEEGKFSARDLAEQGLDRYDDAGGQGRLVFLSVDREAVRAAADFQDGLRRRGRAPSRFAGIPISIKDIFDEAGVVTTAGSRILQQAAAARKDARVVAALKAAGFVIIGRTNMTEFAYSGVGLNPHYGTPLSVFDRQKGRIPGGSSSGAAISVSDGMCALGIGTDTGGSCRIPAAYNGLVGYKPSAMRLDLTGVYPLSPQFDSIGSIGRSVACCAQADAVMAGDWSGEIRDEVPLGQLRLGLLSGAVLEGLGPEVAQAYAGVLLKFGQMGAVLRDIKLAALDDLASLSPKGGIVAAEAYAHHRPLLKRERAGYDPRVASRITLGAELTAADYIDLQNKRKTVQQAFGEAARGVDVIVLPTVMNVPPLLSELAEDKDYSRLNAMSLRNTALGNYLDLCAISLPISPPGHAPVGLMVMAEKGQDYRLFTIAQALEKALSQIHTL